MIAALLAVLKAGGASVPLDPAFPPKRLADMVSDSAPVAILTQFALLERLPPHKARSFSWTPPSRRTPAPHDPLTRKRGRRIRPMCCIRLADRADQGRGSAAPGRGQPPDFDGAGAGRLGR